MNVIGLMAAQVLVVCVAVAAFGGGGGDPKLPNADFHEITARRIEVKSLDGKQSVLITSMENSVGIWVGGGEGYADSAAILSRHGKGHLGPVFLINHPSMLGKGGSGSPLAFSLDSKGVPQVQTVKDGKVKIRELDKLCPCER